MTAGEGQMLQRQKGNFRSKCCFVFLKKGVYPWKFPGTVIFLLTSAFITRLTISYREPDMFLLSLPSKRRSTSSLQNTVAASARMSPTVLFSFLPPPSGQKLYNFKMCRRSFCCVAIKKDHKSNAQSRCCMVNK